MPNRIIRDGFLDSERIATLKWFTECVYHRLLVACDDAGRFDGRSNVLVSRLFPARDDVRPQSVEESLAELGQAGLVLRYIVQDHPYLQVMRWQKCGKALFSKFPWRDGSFGIAYIMRETRDGEKDFVVTSLGPIEPTASAPNTDPMPTPSAPHAHPMPTPCLPRSGESDTETKTKTKTKTLSKTSGKLSFSDQDMKTAKAMLSEIQTRNPGFRQPNLNKWATDVKLMSERDGRTHGAIVALFRWCQRDSFWRGNVLSPGKLREKWEQLAIKSRLRLDVEADHQGGIDDAEPEANIPAWAQPEAKAAASCADREGGGLDA